MVCHLSLFPVEGCIVDLDGTEYHVTVNKTKKFRVAGHPCFIWTCNGGKAHLEIDESGRLFTSGDIRQVGFAKANGTLFMSHDDRSTRLPCLPERAVNYATF